MRFFVAFTLEELMKTGFRYRLAKDGCVEYRVRKPEPIPCYPPPRSHEEQAAYDEHMRIRAAHYQPARSNYGLGIVVPLYPHLHKTT